MADANTGQQHKFATSVTCMDGRIQEPLRMWIAERFGPHNTDTVTQPGMDGVLAGSTNLGDVELARRMTAISVNNHNSRIVVVSGHHDCAGNPVDRERHIRDIKDAVKTVKSWEGMEEVKIMGVWVNENWKAEQVA